MIIAGIDTSTTIITVEMVRELQMRPVLHLKTSERMAMIRELRALETAYYNQMVEITLDHPAVLTCLEYLCEHPEVNPLDWMNENHYRLYNYSDLCWIGAQIRGLRKAKRDEVYKKNMLTSEY